MRVRAMIVLGVLWLLAASAAAEVRGPMPQVPVPRQISVFDGLPSHRVNYLAEDRQGYLWIATRDGLARYDGVGYRIWRVGDGLDDNSIWAVHVDAQDRVWIATHSAGLAMLDAERRRFTVYRRETHPEIGSNIVWTVTSTPDGSIWFGTDGGGLHRLDPEGRVRRFMPDEADPRSLPSPHVTWLQVDRDGELWITTFRGIARWTGRDFERMLQDLPNPSVHNVVMDRAGDLWFTLSNTAIVRRRATGAFEPMRWRDPLRGQPALQLLFQDSHGAHWIDTRSGMAWESGGAFHDVPLYSQTSRGVVRPAWSHVLEDREGGLWFASSDSGLWHLPSNWRDFTVLRRRADDVESPGNAYVRGIAPASGNGYWLVGNGGVLDWLDPGTGRIERHLTSVCGDFTPVGVHETRDGRVWMGCRGILVRYEPRTGEVRRWTANDAHDPAPSGQLAYFAEQSDGRLWIGSEAVQLRDRDGRVLHTIPDGDGQRFASVSALEQLARGPDGAPWLATRIGLLMWNDGARHLEPVPGGPDWQVFAFASGRDGLVWVAGNGILAGYRWTGSELVAERTVGPAQDLPAVAPGGMVVDAQGVVWLTTSRGLVRYDPARQRLRVYGVLDGLPSQEFSDLPLPGPVRGVIAAGTADGLLLYRPQQVRTRARTPTLSVESIRVRRGENSVELPRGSPVILRHDDRDLRVVARLLSFTDAHAHRYRYKLRGYDGDWVATDSTGERLFPRLPYGDYQLAVQARTADEDWTREQVIDFRVEEPWWRTVWAMVAYALLLLLALWSAARAYRGRLKRRHAWQLAVHKRELAEQASLAKTRFLATLGHEVRTPMTGVLGMSELLAKTALDVRQRGYVESIRRAGEHLLRLVNDALDLARIEADRLELESQPFDLHALIREVIDLSLPLAQQKGLKFSSRIADDVPRWMMGDVVRVRQILLNLLGNAVKFTEQGSVALEARVAVPAGVRLSISDTGPGLNEEQTRRLFRRFEQAEGARTAARYGGSGLGLAICQELAAAMGGRVEVESAPGRGATFLVTLPLPVSAPGPGADEGAAARTSSAAALRILLVEDDDTVAEVVEGLLMSRGHSVVRVSNGLAALTEIATRGFEFALLDLDLPGIDGLSLARLLREQGFDRPLVAVTARVDADAEPTALQAGFDGFLRKPLTGALLAAAIDAALAARSDDR